MPRPRKYDNQTNYKKEFNKLAYDRIEITVPKGQKRAVEAHAKSKGESINGLVNGLLRADMGLSEDEWKRAEEKPAT